MSEPTEEPRVLVVGDDLEAARKIRDLIPAGVTILTPISDAETLPDQTTPTDAAEQDDRAHVLVIVLDGEPRRGSHLTRATATKLAHAARLRADAVVIVVAMNGPVRRFDRVLARWIAPEMLHQLDVAVNPAVGTRSRSLRLRLRQAGLLSMGIDVYRVSAQSTRKAR